MKILYFFCGEGLGHTTRAIAACQELEKKEDVVLASYGYARDFASKKGFDVRPVHSEISMAGVSGSFDAQNSVLETIKKFDPKIISDTAQLIRKEKPMLVISDSFFTPAVVAKSMMVPTWMVLNQTNPDMFFPKDGKLQIAGKAVKGFSDLTLNFVDKLIVPDFDMPDAICQRNISMPEKFRRKTEFIGPLVRKEAFKRALPQKKHVFVSIGGFGYRQVMLEKIISVSKTLPDFTFDMVAGPNGAACGKSRNINWHSVVESPFGLMGKSCMFICGGGHSTIMESICVGRPVLSIPDRNHFEQDSNASKVESLGVGKKLDYGIGKKELAGQIESLSRDKAAQRKAGAFSRLARKKQGAKMLSALVDIFKAKQKV